MSDVMIRGNHRRMKSLKKNLKLWIDCDCIWGRRPKPVIFCMHRVNVVRVVTMLYCRKNKKGEEFSDSHLRCGFEQTIEKESSSDGSWRITEVLV